MLEKFNDYLKEDINNKEANEKILDILLKNPDFLDSNLNNQEQILDSIDKFNKIIRNNLDILQSPLTYEILIYLYIGSQQTQKALNASEEAIKILKGTSVTSKKTVNYFKEIKGGLLYDEGKYDEAFNIYNEIKDFVENQNVYHSNVTIGHVFYLYSSKDLYNNIDYFLDSIDFLEKAFKQSIGKENDEYIKPFLSLIYNTLFQEYLVLLSMAIEMKEEVSKIKDLSQNMIFYGKYIPLNKEIKELIGVMINNKNISDSIIKNIEKLHEN